MLNIKPERKPEPGTGRMFDDYWGPSVKLLGDMKFLDKLKTYDKDNILTPTIKRIREKYLTIFFENSSLQSEHIMTYKLLPAKVNQIATCLPYHCDVPACCQPASGFARCLCYL